MEKKLLIVMLSIAATIMLSGCAAWEEAKAKVEGFNKENTTKEEITEVCIDQEEYAQLANKQCVDPLSLEPGKITYFFDKQAQGLLNFIGHSDQFLYCSFPLLNSESIAQQIVEADVRGVEIKVMFDKLSSFDKIGDGNIPKEESQYNYLLSHNIALKVANTRADFCTTEDGVFITNNNFVEEAITYSVIFFDDPESPNRLGLVFQRKFMEWWGG